MNKRYLKYCAAIIILVAGCIGSYLWGAKDIVDKIAMHVTPDQIADAMKNDSFFSSYKEKTLIVEGTVLAISDKGGNVILGFKTSSAFQALCNLNVASSSIQAGDTIRVVALGATAARENSAVLLQDCMRIQ
jgi:hypothetical protein